MLHGRRGSNNLEERLSQLDLTTIRRRLSTIGAYDLIVHLEKQTPDAKYGLVLSTTTVGVSVSEILPAGLCSATEIRVGDVIVAIDNVQPEPTTPSH